MEYSEVLARAREHIGPNCKACPVCDGLGCGNTLPGPGAKKPGNVAHDNYNAWRKIKLNMDVIVPNTDIDTSIEFLGRTLAFPLVSYQGRLVRLANSSIRRTMYGILMTNAWQPAKPEASCIFMALVWKQPCRKIM